MFTYEDFKKSLLPGNYALTKSMEITKVKSSGTLWYTKKFIVLYYYVFLSNELMTREYIGKVNESFRNYIDGLDDAVKADAERFFIPLWILLILLRISSLLFHLLWATLNLRINLKRMTIIIGQKSVTL